ncbi:DUF6624 domain-containing protein [Pseudoduganella armeniaca]|uniref:Uncharacterized protein n=1 Tax=Pseudoduganella armeniaca TaxID=2072590 RepID=A0A2R4CGS3_9BURK|nr:DUF6624 domain-containing protein [Pseudoduganella armeniaca]AVR98849.1 hypothetical protein C9I28_26950 [Pseudoduganella armeniaca]
MKAALALAASVGLLWLGCAGPGWAQASCDTVPRQLETMIGEDQALRARMNRQQGSDATLDAEVLALDARNTAALKDIVARCGWPDAARHGEPAAHAAWLLAQHADHDVEFQLQALDLIRKTGLRDALTRKEFAYLTDRIALKRSGKQVYGTQLKVVPAGVVLPPEEIDSIAAVDRRRAEVGLGSVAEYLRMARQKLARARAGQRQ